MHWEDNAIILGAKPFGETSIILEVFSENHGLHRGLVKGGASKSKKALLQPGNWVNINWKARLNEQLGTFSLEVDKYYSVNLIQNVTMLYGFETIRFYIRLLAEREKNINLYQIMLLFLQCRLCNYLKLAEIFIKFEFAYINAMGVGPDLSCCAATGSNIDLRYISPKSLQAVCYNIGKDWHNKLLPLPKFLLENTAANETEDIINGYKLVTFFLERYIWQDCHTNPILTRKSFFTNIFGFIE